MRVAAEGLSEELLLRATEPCDLELAEGDTLRPDPEERRLTLPEDDLDEDELLRLTEPEFDDEDELLRLTEPEFDDEDELRRLTEPEFDDEDELRRLTEPEFDDEDELRRLTEPEFDDEDELRRLTEPEFDDEDELRRFTPEEEPDDEDWLAELLFEDDEDERLTDSEFRDELLPLEPRRFCEYAGEPAKTRPARRAERTIPKCLISLQFAVPK